MAAGLNATQRMCGLYRGYGGERQGASRMRQYLDIAHIIKYSAWVVKLKPAQTRLAPAKQPLSSSPSSWQGHAPPSPPFQPVGVPKTPQHDEMAAGANETHQLCGLYRGYGGQRQGAQVTLAVNTLTLHPQRNTSTGGRSSRPQQEGSPQTATK